jgi:hypothetical protein
MDPQQRQSKQMVSLQKSRESISLTSLSGGSVPSTAVSANFPADSFGFTGPDKLSLNPQALNSFLQALSSDVGGPVGVDTALN